MYKLENGKLIVAPKVIHRQIQGKEFITTNATEDILTQEGYKYLEEQEKPEITKYQLIKEVLTDNGSTITRTWEVTDKPIIEDEIPEVSEGYELQEYEYVTDTEVHRGKKLVKLPEPEVIEPIVEELLENNNETLQETELTEEEIMEQATNEFPQEVNENSDEGNEQLDTTGDTTIN